MREVQGTTVDATKTRGGGAVTLKIPLGINSSANNYIELKNHRSAIIPA